MAVNARNLLLFIALAGGALLTWMLTRVTLQPQAPAADQGQVPQGYYLVDAVLQGTDDEGRLYYGIHAGRVEQKADGENFVLDRMRVEYLPDTDVRWTIFADRGVADADRDFLRLDKNVRLVYVPVSNQDEVILETNELQLDSDEFLAIADQPVTGRIGQSEFSAAGFELNLKTDFLTLVALTVLTMPAAGQESTDSRIGFTFASCSGNLRSGPRVCEDLSITDGSTVISAGLATSDQFDFNDSAWRLTEGVRFSFDSAEMLADEAVFGFESNELVYAELRGNPVVMTDYIEEHDERVSGTAQTISYDSRSGAVRLDGAVTLTIGDNEFTGCRALYNVLEKTYEIGTADDCAAGIRVLLAPPEESDDAEGPAESP